MSSVTQLALRPAGMFLAFGTFLVLIGAMQQAEIFFGRAMFPGVLTGFILICGGAVLLLFSAAHCLVAKLSGVQMSRALAAITLGILLAGIGFYYAGARSMEAALDSATPSGDAVVRHMIRSTLCGIAALAALVVNAILAVRKGRFSTRFSHS